MLTYEKLIKEYYPGIIFTMEDPFNLDTYKGPEIDLEKIKYKFEVRQEVKRVNEEYHKKELSEFIYKQYPPVKQASDIADKNFYVVELDIRGEENVEKVVASKVADFFGGFSLEEILKTLPEQHRDAYEQLIKAGVRLTWVQKCKRILRDALKHGEEPVYPDIPL